MSEEKDSKLTPDCSPRYCSGEGPECPYCGCVHTADEPYYFNEYGFEMECNDCGREFQVWPNISVTWRTESIATAKSPTHHKTAPNAACIDFA